MENKGYADFWGANKVYYGECGNGELSFLFTTKFSSARQFKNHIELFSLFFR